ncbi:uncharacterized protein V1516DRAFT_661818 [Lipomyces oligophaga]|uniref:uncharacterized protein n=1 Tax=Lipomyces oligophaga TaxID=45792 RepID=UPI0034CE87AC
MPSAAANARDASRVLKSQASRHPGLYVLAGTMVVTFAGMGYWLGISGGTSESYPLPRPRRVTEHIKATGKDQIENHFS